jgi:hypothetical protein
VTYTIEYLKGLAEQATPGPWWVDNMGMFVFGPDHEMIVSEDPSKQTVVLRGVGRQLPMEQNAKFIAAARIALPELIAEVERLFRAVARATVTVPWEAGYGPEYVPIAGDPEQSIKDLIPIIEAKVRKETAERCADIARWYDEGSKTERGIRTHFGLEGPRFDYLPDVDQNLLDYLQLRQSREKAKESTDGR